MFNAGRTLFIDCAYFCASQGKRGHAHQRLQYPAKAERLKYDQVKMSKDMRNSFIIWATILAVGGLLSFFIHNYFAIISLIVWLFLFLKDVHFDPEKAFGKYRL